MTKLRLTLGDSEANRHLEHMGMEAVVADARTMVADETNQIFTTPCYMNPPDLAGMFEGIKQIVAKL